MKVSTSPKEVIAKHKFFGFMGSNNLPYLYVVWYFCKHFRRFIFIATSSKT
eukprot:c33713_g1_i1 orf=1-150(-)